MFEQTHGVLDVCGLCEEKSRAVPKIFRHPSQFVGFVRNVTWCSSRNHKSARDRPSSGAFRILDTPYQHIMTTVLYALLVAVRRRFGVCHDDLCGSNDDVALTEDDVQKLLEGLHTSNSARIAHNEARRWHVRQLCDEWDCGVACLQMVLRWMREDSNDSAPHNPVSSSQLSESEMRERQLILKALQTQSVWTVDLVHAWRELLAMKDGSIPRHKVVFLSQTLSLSEQWRHFHYYRGHFDEDRERLAWRFAQLRENNHSQLQILQAHQVQRLPLSLLISFLQSTRSTVILLVDNSILRSAAANSASVSTYLGHYIVLVNHVDSNFACLDPGRDERLVMYADDVVERAWRAAGTDEDVLLFIRQD